MKLNENNMMRKVFFCTLIADKYNLKLLTKNIRKYRINKKNVIQLCEVDDIRTKQKRGENNVKNSDISMHHCKK